MSFPNNARRLIFPIAIDMGASHTGVFHTFWREEDSPPSQEEIKSKEILSPKLKEGGCFTVNYNNNTNKGNPQFPQDNRRAHRTSLKSRKRAKLAKRYLLLVLKSLGIEINQEEEIVLRHFFNRRGFTFLNTEKEEKLNELLRKLASDLEDGILEEKFNKWDTLLIKHELLNISYIANLQKAYQASGNEWTLDFNHMADVFRLCILLLAESEEGQSFVTTVEILENLQALLLSVGRKSARYFAIVATQKEGKKQLSMEEEAYLTKITQKEAQFLKESEKEFSIQSSKNSKNKLILEGLQILLKEFKAGARHRKIVLGEIEEDLKNTQTQKLKDGRVIPRSPLNALFKNKIQGILSEKEFLNLLGNILNLQRRYLRKYFNDTSFKRNEQGDQWISRSLYQPDRKIKREGAYELFQTYTEVFLEGSKKDSKKSKEQKDRKKRVLSALEAWNRGAHKDNFSWALTAIDPLDTIPPYENGVNRSIPKCRRVYLNEAWVDEKLTIDGRNLKEDVIKALLECYPTFKEGNREYKNGHKKDLEPLIVYSERIGETVPHPFVSVKSRILHRYLDSTKALQEFINLCEHVGRDPLAQLTSAYPLQGERQEILFSLLSHWGEVERKVWRGFRSAYRQAKQDAVVGINLPHFFTPSPKDPSKLIAKKATLRSTVHETRETLKETPFFLCDTNPPLKVHSRFKSLRSILRIENKKKDITQAFGKLEKIVKNSKSSHYEKI